MKKWGFTGSPVEFHSIYEICDSYCGVMKSLADMPSRLEGGDHRTNEK